MDERSLCRGSFFVAKTVQMWYIALIPFMEAQTMLRDEVLMILKQQESDLSGEEISRRLGVTRMAVSNAVKALRKEGYVIDSATNRGYRLRKSPNKLSAGDLFAHLPVSRQSTVRCFDLIDSTNSYLKREAVNGGRNGLVAVANEQTAGRGRSGRSFFSAADCGIYLSILLRPHCEPQKTMTLTAHAAAAVCEAIERACGVETEIKWTNDVVLNGKKLCGILTEITLEGESGLVDSVVIGIGLNVNYKREDFPEALRNIAGSLFSETGLRADRAKLAAEIILALDRMREAWNQNPKAYLDAYRKRCSTTGKEVRVLHGESVRDAFALEITDDFALRVRYDDGAEEILNSGEVSVRGLYGYQ